MPPQLSTRLVLAQPVGFSWSLVSKRNEEELLKRAKHVLQGQFVLAFSDKVRSLWFTPGANHGTMRQETPGLCRSMHCISAVRTGHCENHLERDKIEMRLTME